MDIKVQGNYADAIIHAVDDSDTAVDQHALAQVQMLCDTESLKGATIRVMPDVHAGKVGPIGLTFTFVKNPLGARLVAPYKTAFVGEKVMPGLLGNDIGCGVSCVRFKAKKGLDFQKLDKFIRAEIAPRTKIIDIQLMDDVMGEMRHIRKNPNTYHNPFNGITPCTDSYRKRSGFQLDRAFATFGTLGGGNHFIEVAQGSDGSHWLIVHSGSRNLGQQVYDVYMREGQRELKERGIEVPYEMTWLDGSLREDYTFAQLVACDFAFYSRLHIINGILKEMKWKADGPADDYYGGVMSCTHNYLDLNDCVYRKGAISAHAGEDVIIPINMRDGVIIGKGKGNPDWNGSAPHGAGRLLMRTEVANTHTVSEFKKEMDGIWTSCISKDTLDEAPFAYRRVDQIQAALAETVDVTDVLRPLYNFKNQA